MITKYRTIKHKLYFNKKLTKATAQKVQSQRTAVSQQTA